MPTDAINTQFRKEIHGYETCVFIFQQWNAITNEPCINSGRGKMGQIYEVSVSGATNIDGYANWNKHDLVFFDGFKWNVITHEEKMRLKFEAWLLQEGFEKSQGGYFPHTCNDDEHSSNLVYEDPVIEDNWLVWKAATLSTLSG